MANTINKVILVGHVGKNPIFSTTNHGHEKVHFTIGTHEFYYKDDGKIEIIEWHRITVFRADLVKTIKIHVKMGSLLYIEGRLRTKPDAEIIVYGNKSELVVLDDKSKLVLRKEDDPTEVYRPFIYDDPHQRLRLQ